MVFWHLLMDHGRKNNATYIMNLNFYGLSAQWLHIRKDFVAILV